METRREMENKKLDEAALIGQAVRVYKKYAELGKEIPANEAEEFQRLTKASLTDLVPLDEADFQEGGGRRKKRWTVKTEEGEFIEDDQRFKDFRQTVGTAALSGQFKMAGKDVGAEFMRLFFGDQNAETFRSAVMLARETGYSFSRYSLTDMKNIYLRAASMVQPGDALAHNTWTARFVLGSSLLTFLSKEDKNRERVSSDLLNVYLATAQKLEFGEVPPDNVKAAFTKLGSFLLAAGTDADKEKIFLENAVISQVDLQKELEQRLGRSASPEQVRARVNANGKELGRLWTRFVTASLDQAQAPDLVGRILHLAAESLVLKQFEDAGVSGIQFPSVPPALFANRARAGAYQQMATEKLRLAETLPLGSFEAKELAKRAKQYEQVAAQLWQMGQQAPNQEVAHG